MKKIKNLKSLGMLILLGFLFGIIGFLNKGITQETKTERSFYESSLHYYAHGMAYWYSKENGGLETLTGIPYDKLAVINVMQKPVTDAIK